MKTQDIIVLAERFSVKAEKITNPKDTHCGAVILYPVDKTPEEGIIYNPENGTGFRRDSVRIEFAGDHATAVAVALTGNMDKFCISELISSIREIDNPSPSRLHSRDTRRLMAFHDVLD